MAQGNILASTESDEEREESKEGERGRGQECSAREKYCCVFPISMPLQVEMKELLDVILLSWRLVMGNTQQYW